MPLNYQTQSGVRHQTLGTATITGLLVTATTANTKSGWNNIGTATEFAYEQFILYLNMGTIAAANVVADIGFASAGAATGFTVIAEDIRVDGSVRAHSGTSIVQLPVTIPKDSVVATRISSNVASTNLFVKLIGSSRGLRGMPGYSRCFALSTATNSRGITMLATTGGPLTEGAYSVLTTNSKRRADAVFGIIGTNADTSKTNNMGWAVDIGWGSSTAAANDRLTDIHVRADTNGDQLLNGVIGIYPADIQAGDSIQARFSSTSTATADHALDIMLYGLEP